MSFLLDTDICSAYMKGNHQVWQRFMQYSGRLHVSPVTVGELYTWAFRKGDVGAESSLRMNVETLIRYFP